MHTSSLSHNNNSVCPIHLLVQESKLLKWTFVTVIIEMFSSNINGELVIK